MGSGEVVRGGASAWGGERGEGGGRYGKNGKVWEGRIPNVESRMANNEWGRGGWGRGRRWRRGGRGRGGMGPAVKARGAIPGHGTGGAIGGGAPPESGG